MRFIFKFPDIGEGVTEGKILEWYKDKGHQIQENESLVKIETDKVVTDIPSPRTGTIVARFGGVGDVIQVNDPLVEIEIEGIEGKDIQDVVKQKPQEKSEKPVTEGSFGVVGTLEVAGDAAFLPLSDEDTSGKKENNQRMKKVLATPVARAMAKDLGVAISDVPGTGPAGRITKKDIQRFASTTHLLSEQTQIRPTDKKTEQLVEFLPLSQIRKTIAKNMMASKQSLAHMTLFEEVELSDLIKTKKRHKEAFASSGIKLTYLAFITKAVAKCLQKHPILNGRIDIDHDRILVHKNVNIAIAVDTDEGLVVPVIRNADTLSIADIAKNIQELSEKAHKRELGIDDMRHGTFTITNPGSLGGYSAVPIINYPQSAILGIGRIVKKPIVREDQIDIGNVMHLFLSVDHRLIDGGDATRFMASLVAFLSDPVSLVIY